MINIDAGEKLFASAVPLRLKSAPAFALERLPNRNSLVYGDLYGISKEASTIFRATLRYEGFSRIMNVLGELGYFETESHPLLKSGSPPTYKAILESLLLKVGAKSNAGEKSSLANTLASLNCCQDTAVAESVATCIR